MLPILTVFGWSVASYKSILYSSFWKHLPFYNNLKQRWFEQVTQYVAVTTGEWVNVKILFHDTYLWF